MTEQKRRAGDTPEDDTEGQAMHWSNRDLKEDIEPLDTPQAPESAPADDATEDDTEGQSMHWSNRDLKEDIEPLEDDAAEAGPSDKPGPQAEENKDEVARR